MKTFLHQLLRPFLRRRRKEEANSGEPSRKSGDRDAEKHRRREPADDPVRTHPEKVRFSRRVERDLQLIQDAFGHSADLVVRRFRTARGEEAAVVFINGLVSTPSISRYIIEPVMTGERPGETVAAEANPLAVLRDALTGLTYGQCLLLRDGRDPVACDVRDWEKRSVPTAELEPSEQGSNESFLEDLATNTVLIRRRLRTENLQIEKYILGRESRTEIRVAYLRHIARDELVDEVRRRLQRIDIDAPLSLSFLQELITDTPWSPIPNAVLTARPDRTAGMLLEGHVAILMDGTPMAMLVPGTFVSMLQAADDYASNFYAASFTRGIRWLATLIALLASPVYVSIISYHSELLPTRLLFTIAAGRDGVPFPPLVEAFLMELAFELLREAGLRVPRQIGQAVSIVGVLIIGDAAVRAGLISPFMIVVVGLSAISSFAIPSPALADTVRLLRFPMILLGGILGLFAVTMGVLVILAIMISARSFGVPFFTPFAPMVGRELEDAMVRSPAWRQLYRPWQVVQLGRLRQQPSGQKPQPQSSREDPDGS
nr:spore germination protein [Bacillota bacterium]